MKREDRLYLRSKRKESWDGDGSTLGHLVYVFRSLEITMFKYGPMDGLSQALS